jgi:hypothetical protein
LVGIDALSSTDPCYIRADLLSHVSQNIRLKVTGDMQRPTRPLWVSAKPYLVRQIGRITRSVIVEQWQGRVAEGFVKGFDEEGEECILSCSLYVTGIACQKIISGVIIERLAGCRMAISVQGWIAQWRHGSFFTRWIILSCFARQIRA